MHLNLLSIVVGPSRYLIVDLNSLLGLTRTMVYLAFHARRKEAAKQCPAVV